MADRDNPGGISLDFTGAQALLASLHSMKPRKLTEAGVEHLSFGDAEGRACNLVIEGDNLQALASLPHQYSGRIDFIYADPPYNTGTTKENFRYNDKWLYDPDTDDPGSFVTDSTPGRHERWMNFMYPRLQACKRMLKPGGVIAVSIDDRELARLILLMDAVFGEGNRLGFINWQKKDAPSSDSKHLSPSTEYVLVYANRLEFAETGSLDRTSEMNSRFSNPDSDPQQLWRQNNPTAKSNTPGSSFCYGIQSPFTGEMFYPRPGRQWSHKRSTMKAWLEEWSIPYSNRPGTNPKAADLCVDMPIEEAREIVVRRLSEGAWPRLYWSSGGSGRPNIKAYLHEVKQGRVPTTYFKAEDTDDALAIGSQAWPHETVGSNRNARTLLNEIMGDHGFATPKPLKLIETLVSLWCPPGGIVLDPFAGSGTTAHAVLDLNYETEGEEDPRSFIMIESGVRDDVSTAQNEEDLFARTLTAERIRRVITGQWADGKPHLALGGGFTFRTTGSVLDEGAINRMERAEIVEVISQIELGRDPRAFFMDRIAEDGFAYLIGQARDGRAVALVWDGADSLLTRDVSEAIYAEAGRMGMTPPPPIRVYARKSLFPDPDFDFRQIPEAIITELGGRPGDA